MQVNMKKGNKNSAKLFIIPYTDKEKKATIDYANRKGVTAAAEWRKVRRGTIYGWAKELGETIVTHNNHVPHWSDESISKQNAPLPEINPEKETDREMRLRLRSIQAAEDEAASWR